MSPYRVWQVTRIDLAQFVRRPLCWIWALILAVVAWRVVEGGLVIESGDSATGGAEAHMTSEFGIAFLVAVMSMLIFSFFTSVLAGTTLLRDIELRVGEILHATPLRAREYVWGKFLAAWIAGSGMLLVYLLFTMTAQYGLVDIGEQDKVGPFSPWNYLKPGLLFGFPALTFFCGAAFWVGERTRRSVLVYILPVALLLACDSFIWGYSPEDLAPWKNSVLMAVDPVGFRWLNEVWLKVDRGADFYNTRAIVLDGAFIGNRLGTLLLGLLFVQLAARDFARRLRGDQVGAAVAREAEPDAKVAPAQSPARPLAELGMRSGRPGFLAGTLAVARVELRELRSQPGLYLFVPLIVLLAVSAKFALRGTFDAPILATPGLYAIRMTSMLTTLIVLLMTFYMVESLRREKAAGLAPILYATPVRTGSLLLGKALANSSVGLAILGVTFVTAWVVLLFEPVTFDATPFALVWGLLLLPTFLLWSTFVAAVWSLTGNRYTTYGIAFGALAWTGFQLHQGELSWLSNWPMWRILLWSDMGLFELVRTELALNRLLCIAVAGLLIAITVRQFPRRATDAARTLVRLQPRALARSGVGLTLCALPALVLAFVLDGRIDAGHQGEAAREGAKDYWRKHVQTWKDAPQPVIVDVDLELVLEPAEGRFQVSGSYELENDTEAALGRFALTGNPAWEGSSWTVDGEALVPEDPDDRLLEVRLAQPLPPGGRVRIGFVHGGPVPQGATSNGGGASEFILPSGIVLTSFAASFVPVVGFIEGLGVDEENRSDSRRYPPGYHVGRTPALFGTGARSTVRTRIDAPEAYIVHGVGSLVEEQFADGRRRATYRTEHPVSHFNVVGGRWAVLRGAGTAIYHHPAHSYNVAEMSATLDAARAHYSEWFAPFPWEELRLSEFPGLAGYAQGFATNITFSEAVGFLTKSTPDHSAVFEVTAHEAAHQWWGGMLVPGRGPGGNILSEGMAHFATILLLDEERGARGRISFCRRIEDSYGEGRSADSERALYQIDGSRKGDETVTYDKGGWVFWMLLQHLGRDACLAGMRSFLQQSTGDPDHPVLEDFIDHMRPFAADPQAYEAFVQQWFFTVVLPEFRLHDLRRERSPEGTWILTGRLENIGSGDVRVQVAAERGERFPAEEATADWENERVALDLGAGESVDFRIETTFDPERVRVDPDALVLQLRRKDALRDL